MLPALQLRCEPGEGHSFTCRPQWVRPLESLWSILAKWQFVNCLPYSTIVATLMMPSATTPDQGVDLRVLSHSIWMRLLSTAVCLRTCWPALHAAQVRIRAFSALLASI